MSSDRRRVALTLRVRDYYASERLYLLRCLKHLLSFYSEQHHPYSVSTAAVAASRFDFAAKGDVASIIFILLLTDKVTKMLLNYHSVKIHLAEICTLSLMNAF